jgi:hypothetical protein
LIHGTVSSTYPHLRTTFDQLLVMTTEISPSQKSSFYGSRYLSAIGGKEIELASLGVRWLDTALAMPFFFSPLVQQLSCEDGKLMPKESGVKPPHCKVSEQAQLPAGLRRWTKLLGLSPTTRGRVWHNSRHSHARSRGTD